MNKIETIVYGLVRKNPALKQFIRNVYQSAFDLFPKEKEFFTGKIDYREGYFFGFHDVTPFSKDERKILANKLDFDLRMPQAGEGITVGYFDFDDGKLGEFHEFGTSNAWNYHKGCRLQWINDTEVIYNSAEGDKICSIITNIESGVTKTIPYPIDAIYGNQATSFSYERLERCMPGYGYPYKDNGELDEVAPSDMGLFLIDLTSGKRELLITLEEIAKEVTGIVENEYLHFVTHSEFSKDGRYISFLYRRIPRVGDYMKRRSVICVYDRTDKRLIILPSQESGSHYVWNNRNQIIASCIIGGKSCHVLFDMGEINQYRIIAPETLNSDGHQTFVTDELFITDTYPDKRRMTKLYSANVSTNETKLLGKFYSPKKYQTKDFKCHIACDLHPRISPSGKYLCFDSPRSGKRSICVMQV